MVRLTLSLLSLSPAASAAFRDRDAGSSAGQFLKLGADARSAGMGQAARAASEDATAVYWNPAGLAALRHRHLTFTHAAYYQSVFYDFLAYAQPVPSVLLSRRERGIGSDELGTVGLGLLYLNAGQIGEIDNTGTVTGETFTPQDFAFIVGWGLPLSRQLELGLSGKLLSSRIKGSASTGAFDLGARWRWRILDRPHTISVGAHHIGGGLRFHSEQDPLPLTLAIGNSLRPARNWLVSFDLVAPRDNAPYPALGTEYRFQLDPETSASLRLGYEGRASADDLEGFTGLAAGGGLSLSRFAVDYAWTPFGSLGDAHRFSLSYRF